MQNSKLFKTVILSTVMIFLSLSCAKKDLIDFGFVTFYYGDVKVKKSGDILGKSDPKLKMILKAGDVVYTGEDSRMDVQLQNFGLIRINQNSRVDLDKVITGVNESIELGLDKGQVLCKVMRLKKNQSFNVNTPTAVAGVRGTTFLVDAREDKKTSEVAVQSGSVEVTDKKDPENKVTVNKNETAKVDYKTKAMKLVKGIDAGKLKEFKAIKDVKILKDIKNIKINTLKDMSIKKLKSIKNVKSLKDLNVKDLKGLGDEFKSFLPGSKEADKGAKKAEDTETKEDAETKKEEKKAPTIEDQKKKLKDAAVEKAKEKAKEKLKKFKF